jgi:predicted CXXCH cytochrome family protein
MAHDHNGRVSPPRCEECNAPLNSDELRSVSELARSLCLDCHREWNPFPVIKKKRRFRAGWRARAFIFSSFENAIPNSEVEPLVRP